MSFQSVKLSLLAVVAALFYFVFNSFSEVHYFFFPGTALQFSSVANMGLIDLFFFTFASGFNHSQCLGG